jgi:2-dehydro-3-deoxyglucarate aldolase/4-hydroxy-2-oxoheptanedioate aldolase
MRENPVKAALRAGKTPVGVGLTIAANPLVARVLATAGYDWLFIDIEHSMIPCDTLIAVVQMARASGLGSVVRTQDTEYHLIANVLDTGADAVMVPRVETAEQAARAVSYARFPPDGVRGCGTSAVLGYGHSDWPVQIPWLNEQTMVIVQVESMRSVENLPEIIEVPGVDAVFVGRFDLSIDLGVPGDIGHPKTVEAMERITDTCVAAGKPVGTILGSPEALQPWWERGMRLLVCSADISMLLEAGTRCVRGVRAFAGEL